MLCRTMALMFQPAQFGWLPPTNGSIDSETHPVRCHWEEDADADRCVNILQYMGESWDAQVDGIGFNAPVPDDDGILDVYIYNEPQGGAYTACTTYRDEVDDGYSACPGYIALARSISTEEMSSYIAHEFNHVLQYATDFNELTLPIWEGTATASEQWTYPKKLTPTLNYVAHYQATPWAGLSADGYFLWQDHKLWSFYEYGSALWILHLDHHFGNNAGSAAQALWQATAQEGSTNKPDVIDAYDTITGDWQEALLSLSAERVGIGTKYTPEWAAFTDGGADLHVDGTLKSATLPTTFEPGIMPYGTGVTYVKITDIPAGKQVVLDATVPSESTWGVVAVNGAEQTWTRGTTITMAGPGDVVLGLVNLDHDAFHANASWPAMRATQREVALGLSLEDAPDDTGEPADDTGEPTDDTGDTTDDTGNTTPPGDTGDDNGGCGGCSTGTGGGAGWLLAGLVGLARRRRR